MENGLHGFYEDFSAFLLNLRNNRYFQQIYEEDKHAMTFDQLRNPLKICFFKTLISLFVFLIEVSVYRFKKWLRR